MAFEVVIKQFIWHYMIVIAALNLSHKLPIFVRTIMEMVEFHRSSDLHTESVCVCARAFGLNHCKKFNQNDHLIERHYPKL